MWALQNDAGGTCASMRRMRRSLAVAGQSTPIGSDGSPLRATSLTGPSREIVPWIRGRSGRLSNSFKSRLVPDLGRLLAMIRCRFDASSPPCRLRRCVIRAATTSIESSMSTRARHRSCHRVLPVSHLRPRHTDDPPMRQSSRFVTREGDAVNQDYRLAAPTDGRSGSPPSPPPRAKTKIGANPERRA